MQYSILSTNEIKNENITFRIDAEFFKAEYLETINLVEKHNYSYIEEVSSWVTQGPNPVFSESGIPCLTGRNINKGEVSYIKSDYVNENEYKKLVRFQLNIGDTLITLKGKGSIGKIGYVTDKKNSIFSRDIGIIRPSKINAGYLNIFILTKYGKLLVDRGETGGTGQSTLTTSYLKSIPIPRFIKLEEQSGDILEKVELLKKQSKVAKKQAKELLLSELNLNNWKPKHQLSFIKNHSEVQQAERIDAEYYQPKYEDIVNAIKGYTSGWDTLENITTVKSKNFTPLEKIKYNYIELSNISGNGEITGSMFREGQDLPSRARRIVSKGDVIVSSIEGSLESIALVKQDHENSLCSTGFYVINSTKLNSETLLVFLKSVAGQLQLKKGCNGTILTAINKDEFNKIILPIVAKETQTKIQQKITESFTLRKQSKHLLECAKRAVEIAIEEDEEVAMLWLDKQITL